MTFLLSSSPAKSYPSEMSGININTMKELLAEQRKDLLSDMKAQIVTEVAAQLEPHTTRLEQLHDDQNLMKKQLEQISSQLQLWPLPDPAHGAPPEPHGNTHQPVPVAHGNQLPPQVPCSASSLSLADIEEIERAKCTLDFTPITSEDLDRVKNSENEKISTEALLTRAFKEFLDVKLCIPLSTISKIAIKNISHSEEVDFQTVTVEFPNICPVNTVFKYVRNLTPEQKVNIHIPAVLEPKHDELRNWSFHLRTAEPKHKTVIKYLGHDLAMYAKRLDRSNWFLVTSPPGVSPNLTQKSEEPQNATEK